LYKAGAIVGAFNADGTRKTRNTQKGYRVFRIFCGDRFLLDICCELGGFGHAVAAGFQIRKSPDEVSFAEYAQAI
jgi:nanoRNase/pAp phosphatase (c-di-AMP/oligoRNAs hydrolase)